MTDPIEPHADLDQLLARQTLPAPPRHFTEYIMDRVGDEPPLRPFWQHPWLQWAAVGLGLGFGLTRLVSYVFGVWLAMQSAL